MIPLTRRWRTFVLAAAMILPYLRADDYSAAAARTMETIQKSGASWSLTQTFNGVDMTVNVVQTADMRRLELVATIGGQRTQWLWTIVERDGMWYVKEIGASKPRRYRPYEAVLGQSAAYLLIQRSELQFAGNVDGPPARRDDGKDVYVVPLDPNRVKQIKATLNNFEALRRRPDYKKNPQLETTMNNLKILLAKGVETVVDPKTGIVVKDGFMDRAYTISRFTTPIAAGKDVFAVKPSDYADLAKPRSYDTLIMTQYFPAKNPAAIAKMKPDYETVLLDLKSDVITRVPFNGFGMSSGCLSSDKKTVYLSALAPGESMIQPHAIDLESGEQRVLRFDELMKGQTLVGSLSPDDGHLLVTNLRPGKMTLGNMRFQNYLIDLKANVANVIGPELDASGFLWLPDGSGLIFEKRIPQEGSRFSRRQVARMDLDGTVTVLCDGASPVILDGPRILFRKGKEKLWYVCDVDGKNVKRFHDGLEGCFFPSYRFGSPFLITNKRDLAKGNPLHRIDLKTGKATPVTKHVGLWAWPKM